MFPLGVMLMLHDYHSAVLNTKHNNKSVLKNTHGKTLFSEQYEPMIPRHDPIIKCLTVALTLSLAHRLIAHRLIVLSLQTQDQPIGSGR